jgi:hypothetical protein
MSKVKVYRSQQIREWILLLTGKLFLSNMFQTQKIFYLTEDKILLQKI